MESHERRADEMERDAERLERERDRVDGLIDDAREDWDSKKSSVTAPGATEPEEAAPGGLGEQEEEDEGENADA